MKTYIAYFVTLLVVMTNFTIEAQNTSKNFQLNCFSVVVGSKASEDNSVFLAHNEDDFGERMVNWYKVKKGKPRNKSITLKRGGLVDQVAETNAYTWIEIPELEFSDTYMNEYGVTITSNACPSREDRPDLVDDGIGYWLRRLMIERAFTAKEAVTIGGQLIDKMGYASSGRTYVIADPYEAWMFSVVYGKHWVAQRVPNNHVAIIPNYYTITTIDLSDSNNFLGSKDLIDYAIERGWYNPETDGEFDFRLAYSNPNALMDMDNKARHWVALNILSRTQYSIDESFPFSFVPKKKVSLADLFSVLRNHYEETDLDTTNNYTTLSPHDQDIMTVCSRTNQYGFVAQLRNWMPAEIGSILWIAPTRPCSNPFVPLYSGMNYMPKNFAVKSAHKAISTHFDKLTSFFPYKNHYHFLSTQKAKQIDNFYVETIPRVSKQNLKKESELFMAQKRFEAKMMKLFIDNAEKVKVKLTEYSIEAVDELFKDSKARH